MSLQLQSLRVIEVIGEHVKQLMEDFWYYIRISWFSIGSWCAFTRMHVSSRYMDTSVCLCVRMWLCVLRDERDVHAAMVTMPLCSIASAPQELASSWSSTADKTDGHRWREHYCASRWVCVSFTCCGYLYSYVSVTVFIMWERYVQWTGELQQKTRTALR